MARLIDADSLIKEICRDQCEREAKGCGSRCELVIYADNEPTVDAVRVVRCEDCKHLYFADNRIPEEQCWVCELEHQTDMRFDFNWYCADGERREDNAAD